MSGLRIKKGDLVKIITGSDKGKTGKVVAVQPNDRTVTVEGINIVKRHVKPSMVSPQGGIVDVHKPMDISKVALVQAGSKDGKTSRVAYVVDKAGDKKRVYRQAKNKEIDS
ncbi:50S ribosomal protein L24 [Candidatus Saccharibacteria bacterium]|nr:50S ribosomal protein L24 [Candidatus Saccharibacteria bacterium]